LWVVLNVFGNGAPPSHGGADLTKDLNGFHVVEVKEGGYLQNRPGCAATVLQALFFGEVHPLRAWRQTQYLPVALCRDPRVKLLPDE
jgi:hypothetical protein